MTNSSFLEKSFDFFASQYSASLIHYLEFIYCPPEYVKVWLNSLFNVVVPNGNLDIFFSDNQLKRSVKWKENQK